MAARTTTPTSAFGIKASAFAGGIMLSVRRASPQHYSPKAALHQGAGFTLIEVLVVIVIIAMMSSLAVLSIGDSFERKLRSEAERLQTVLLAASEEAIYGSSEFGIYLTENRYAPLRYDRVARGWVLIGERPFLTHELPAGMVMELTVDGFVPPTDEAIGGDSDDIDYEDRELFADDDNERETEDAISQIRDAIAESGIEESTFGSLAAAIQLETVSLQPQVTLLSSGEQTAFRVVFRSPDPANESQIELKSDGFSMPRVKSLTRVDDAL